MKTEEQFLKSQIKFLQSRLDEISVKTPPKEVVFQEYDYLIEFDGGTSCNIPAKGYGNGYGSFRITCKGDDPESSIVERVKLGPGYSCNAAEIGVLAHAITKLHSVISMSNNTGASIHCIGDSQIALGWLTKKTEPRSATCPKFPESIARLRAAMTGFKSVTGQWRTRTESVRIFGH